IAVARSSVLILDCMVELSWGWLSVRWVCRPPDGKTSTATEPRRRGFQRRPCALSHDREPGGAGAIENGCADRGIHGPAVSSWQSPEPATGQRRFTDHFLVPGQELSEGH